MIVRSREADVSKKLTLEHQAADGWHRSQSSFIPQTTPAAESTTFVSTAYVRCSICGAEFTYKERRPTKAGRTIAFAAFVVMTMAVLTTDGVPLLIMSAISGTLLIVGMWREDKASEPFFQQFRGSTAHKHCVKSVK